MKAANRGGDLRAGELEDVLELRRVWVLKVGIEIGLLDNIANKYR